ncbi:multicopper oxidase [Myriangium duriaei CBS 260.36]|uniref:Multicopper oxidase n=1 Tax=Myriangium duriaei CBS 260.36 TaxID=1168546 RepID=A0A9P4MIN2_9PEZI|nr:multicopper oxidase [Myriangium duriaei CBS 260.36]
MAPDGVEVPVLVVNNQFPGPLIEANWGDWIQVDVTNGLETEGTAMHWHGFLQTGTPWYDGAPGVTHCPIAPGQTFTYRFRAELYGTTWWHSHYTAQYLNGLLGPIVIHGPKTASYDIDVGPILLSDWFHDYYVNLVRQVFVASEVGPIFPPMADNMLIQGKSDYPCNATTLKCTPDAGFAEFKFQSGKKHLLRLVNTAAEAIIFFSIDNHNITVIANDFVAVEPYQTDLVVLGVGQRTDIIVEGNGSPNSSAWLRITEGPTGLGPAGQTGCSLNTGVRPATKAAIFYENADTTVQPTTTSAIDPSRFLFPINCANQPLTVTTPQPVIPVAEPDVTMNFIMTGGDNATGDFVWWMNNQTFYADWNDPILLEAKLNNLNFPPERAVFDMKTASSVRLNITSIGFPASHPMHLHGHNMQVLAEGLGSWDGTIVNPQNPQRRDTQIMRPNGFLVVQWNTTNPGMWMFHCHIAWHISEGNGINFLEQTPTLQGMQFPGSIAQTCRDWAAHNGHAAIDQIDSGL